MYSGVQAYECMKTPEGSCEVSGCKGNHLRTHYRDVGYIYTAHIVFHIAIYSDGELHKHT